MVVEWITNSLEHAADKKSATNKSHGYFFIFQTIPLAAGLGYVILINWIERLLKRIYPTGF